MLGQLIRERLLGGQQASAKLRVTARKRPARRNRLLIDIGVEMLRRLGRLGEASTEYRRALELSREHGYGLFEERAAALAGAQSTA